MENGQPSNPSFLGLGHSRKYSVWAVSDPESKPATQTSKTIFVSEKVSNRNGHSQDLSLEPLCLETSIAP